MIETRWYTVEEIADMLKVHVNTVRRWVREHKLAGHNFGGRTGYRIREQDFRAFLDERFEDESGKLAA